MKIHASDTNESSSDDSCSSFEEDFEVENHSTKSQHSKHKA
jgi:hypothetical protein